MFKRNISDETIKALIEHDLYRSCLKSDIFSLEKRRGVFPAIRNNRIDFYHRGGRLFSFSSKGIFETHIKYASVINTEDQNQSVTEDIIKVSELVPSFVNGYSRIKENCWLYSGIESEGVSYMYSRYPFLNTDSEVVVLDVEIQFPRKNKHENEDANAYKTDMKTEGDGKRDITESPRIDLLLYHKSSRKLRFVEAKHYSNTEVWSMAGKKPPVTRIQIPTYEKSIKENHGLIISEYGKYVGFMRQLFRLTSESLPDPTHLDPRVAFLLFGFDSKQKGKITELLKKDGSVKGTPYYFIGNIDKIEINTLWKKTSKV